MRRRRRQFHEPDEVIGAEKDKDQPEKDPGHQNDFSHCSPPFPSHLPCWEHGKVQFSAGARRMRNLPPGVMTSIFIQNPRPGVKKRMESPEQISRKAAKAQRAEKKMPADFTPRKLMQKLKPPEMGTSSSWRRGSRTSGSATCQYSAARFKSQFAGSIRPIAVEFANRRGIERQFPRSQVLPDYTRLC